MILTLWCCWVSFRSELKYRLKKYELLELKKLMQLNSSCELYPSRTINSVYFDTNDLRLFFESEEGLLPRKKLRIRWYDTVENSTIETKLSSIEGRYKKTVKSKFETEKNIFNQHFIDNIYGYIYPSFKISYDRAYYKFNGLRVTVDKNIKYENLRSNIHNVVNETECVMEVKTVFETPRDTIEKAIPFQTSRFSKYSKAALAFGY